jgi:hypothetical protein
MATDTSKLIYVCPVCEKFARSMGPVLSHVQDSEDEEHRRLRKRNDELEPLIEFRSPSFDADINVERWMEEFVEAHEAIADAGEDWEVSALSSRLSNDIPSSFVAFVASDFDYEGVHTKTATCWRDLTTKQQNTLLTWVYYPDKIHSEIASMSCSGHDSQSSVSSTIRKHGWMFYVPGTGTPVSATDDEKISEWVGELKTESFNVTEEVAEPEPDDEQLEAECQECGESHDDGACWDEEDDDERDGEAGKTVEVSMLLNKDEGFRIVKALIESDSLADTELAEKLWNRSVDSVVVEL